MQPISYLELSGKQSVLLCCIHFNNNVSLLLNSMHCVFHALTIHLNRILFMCTSQVPQFCLSYDLQLKNTLKEQSKLSIAVNCKLELTASPLMLRTSVTKSKSAEALTKPPHLLFTTQKVHAVHRAFLGQCNNFLNLHQNQTRYVNQSTKITCMGTLLICRKMHFNI